MTASFDTDFRLGTAWRIQPKLNRIHRLGTRDMEAVTVEPKVMHVLVCLAEADGDVVTRDHLLAMVWGDVVVGDYVLNRAVSELRKIFRSGPSDAPVIETIRKVGYRLVVPVRPVLPRTSGDGVWPELSPEPQLALTPAPAVRTSTAPNRWSWLWGSLLLLGLASVGFVEWWQRPLPVLQVDHAGIRPLTSDIGHEAAPTLSPDGQRVAYVKHTPQQQTNIYLKQRGQDDALPLTTHAGFEGHVAFSPDGTQLTFTRWEKGKEGIYIRPVLGQQERKLLDCIGCTESGLDWSPDGQTLAFAHQDSISAPRRMHLFDLDAATLRAVTTPSMGRGDHFPTFAPDGQTLAFVRTIPGQLHLPELTPAYGHLFTLDLATFQLEQQTTVPREYYGLTWFDTERLLASGYTLDTRYTVWSFALGDATPLPIFSSGNVLYGRLDATSDGLAIEFWKAKRTIQRVALGADAETVPFLPSSRHDWGARYSPNGAYVAFLSQRSGHDQVWIADADGAQAYRLTHFETGTLADLAWSPDSKQVAFTREARGQAGVYVAPIAGQEVQALPMPETGGIAPSFSVEGNTLYYSTPTSEGWQIVRQDLRVPNTPAVVLSSGRYAQEGADGYVYFSQENQEGLWRASHSDLAHAELVTPLLPQWAWQTWNVHGQQIVFPAVTSDATTDESIDLYTLDLQTGVLTKNQPLPSENLVRQSGISLSPDGTSLLYAVRAGLNADLMYVPLLN